MDATHAAKHRAYNGVPPWAREIGEARKRVHKVRMAVGPMGQTPAPVPQFRKVPPQRP